ncbi:hypothetical protein GCM10009811_15970 [Nostocoides veronense]|uniref:Uncharacterized protein n=1 Tax=Nostocoides veronense TaxID=330836 RepID=A0ABN2LKW2_9MICO
MGLTGTYADVVELDDDVLLDDDVVLLVVDDVVELEGDVVVLGSSLLLQPATRPAASAATAAARAGGVGVIRIIKGPSESRAPGPATQRSTYTFTDNARFRHRKDDLSTGRA